MKLKEYISMEMEQLEILKKRSQNGDNVAAKVILDHCRTRCQDMSDWQEKQKKRESKKRAPDSVADFPPIHHAENNPKQRSL